MKTLKIISVIIAALLFIAATVVAAFFVAYFILTSDVKLDEEKLASRTPACVIYADDGNIIEESVQTNYVTIDKIPDITKKAFIATEDKRFYDHGGVDVKGILRASVKNVLSGKLKEGGSTIS
ncbi:MAG: transglycosylase domain-containing protein, partial [Clostridia bacterium]|nr:transglycosylase domain-containing protein [Clostridia bacterium]